MSVDNIELMLPVPLRASKKAIHEFAEKVAVKLSYKPRGSIEDIVKKLGGEIEHSDPFDGGIPESIRVRDFKDFTIFISALTSSKRDRFTIAHELGHYILHFPTVRKNNPTVEMHATRWVGEGNDDLQRTEWEANWFAAGFLMPSKDFKSSFEEGGPETAAETFGVSKAAAEVRAKSLGLM